MNSREAAYRTLTEVGKVGRGKSKHRPRNDPDLYGGEYPFIQTGDVKHAPFYVTSHSQTYNEQGLAQSKLWPTGTLCITIAANIGDTALLTYPACFPDSILGFEAKPNEADARYIKYCLDAYKAQIQLMSQGTTQDNLSLEKLLKMRFWIPELQVQQKIAANLSAYDELIANNQRRIVLLGSMADDIYREWFVRMRFPGYRDTKLVKGLPAGWSTVPVRKVADINSQSIRPGARPQSIRYLDIGSVGTNECTIPEPISYISAPGRARRIVQHGDILWSSVRPGNRAYCLMLTPPKDLVASTGFAVITARDGMPFSYLYRAVTTTDFVDQMVAVAKGSAYPATSFDDFERARIVLPPQSLLHRFHATCEPMLTQESRLRAINAVAAQQRDALLPRLISGKLRVDALDICLPPGMREEAEQASSKAVGRAVTKLALTPAV